MRDDADVETAAVVSLEPSAGPEGFILEEIEMRGFMRYLEKTVPPLRFPEKYTVITGRTGSGKSSNVTRTSPPSAWPRPPEPWRRRVRRHRSGRCRG